MTGAVLIGGDAVLAAVVDGRFLLGLLAVAALLVLDAAGCLIRWAVIARVLDSLGPSVPPRQVRAIIRLVLRG